MNINMSKNHDVSSDVLYMHEESWMNREMGVKCRDMCRVGKELGEFNAVALSFLTRTSSLCSSSATVVCIIPAGICSSECTGTRGGDASCSVG